VTLFKQGNPLIQIGSGLAGSSDQLYALNVQLSVGDQVYATQKKAGFKDSFPPKTTEQVIPAPTVAGDFKTPVNICSECVWIGNLIPGASVEIKVGNQTRGTGDAIDGNAHIHLKPATAPGEKLVAIQTACGKVGPQTSAPPPDSVPLQPDGRLPTPSVDGPLHECDRWIHISHVFPGASVTVKWKHKKTSAVTEESYCFDYDNYKVPLQGALQHGDEVSAMQAFQDCDASGRPSLYSPVVTVGPATPVPVPVPVIGADLCDGGSEVAITGLTPGNLIEIFMDGQSLGSTEISDSSETFNVSQQLKACSLVTAYQGACDLDPTKAKWSDLSNPMSVRPTPDPAKLTKPNIPGPLYEGATVVRVTGMTPGATAVVYSTKLGLAGSPYKLGAEQACCAVPHGKLTSVDVEIHPPLGSNDSVYAVQACGDSIGPQSSSASVKPPSSIPAPMVLSQLDDCMRAVPVAAVTPGAIVEVYVQPKNQKSFFYRGTAKAGAKTAYVPITGHLQLDDQVQARQILNNHVSNFSLPSKVQVHAACGYVTQHFDNARTGWNPDESILTIGNVQRNFNPLPLFSQPLDGTAYAQPLYVRDVVIPDKGMHNVVFVATENNSVYAFDADQKMDALWQRNLVPICSPNEFPVHSEDVYGDNQGNVAPTIGITSTPVIDLDTNTMYVVAKSETKKGEFYNRLYALDITTGCDKPGSPVEIQAKIQGKGPGPRDEQGNLLFDPKAHFNRSSLLLQNGIIYIAFASHGDAVSPAVNKYLAYHGWVMAYDASTLQQVGVFNSSPDHPLEQDQFLRGGAIWQSGMGLASDGKGNIYFATGNGPFTASVGGREYGDSVLKLSHDLKTVLDYFTPCNQCHLYNSDSDLGSGGVMVVPHLIGGKTRLVACGKEGTIYVMNSNNLGKYNDPNDPQCTQDVSKQYCQENKVIQTLWRVLGAAPTNTNEARDALFGGPAYYNIATRHLVYYCGSDDPLRAFEFDNTGKLSTSSIDQSPDKFPHGGAIPVVSGNNDDRAIVWVLDRNMPTDQPGKTAVTLHLYAYKATQLNKGSLFKKPLDAGQWANQYGIPFLVPTVINGKVYVASGGTWSSKNGVLKSNSVLNVFGLK
jgi:hypothetical protein